MSKKHFNKIAAVFADLAKNPALDKDTLATVAANLAIICKADNPRFDSERFLAACAIYMEGK